MGTKEGMMVLSSICTACLFLGVCIALLSTISSLGSVAILARIVAAILIAIGIVCGIAGSLSQRRR